MRRVQFIEGRGAPDPDPDPDPAGYPVDFVDPDPAGSIVGSGRILVLY